MHFKLLTIFCVFLLLNYVRCSSILAPCKSDDFACIERSINAAIPQLMSADPSQKIDSSDPLHLDFIEGNLSILKYKFTNPITTGFKKCTVSNLRANMEDMTFHLDLICPGLNVKGDYIVSGRLIILPVEGEGTFGIESSKYKIGVDGELKKTEKDGKTYVAIKNIKLKNEAMGPIKFTFNNLFNGQKDLSEAVHKFANENWKEVADLVQDPVFYGNMKKIVSNVNKYLKTTPLEEMVV